MSYIGSTPTSQNFTSGTDYFSGTGSQTAFTLTRTVNSVNDIEVVINNVVQQPSTAYTLSGTTITFTSAPSSGTNNIYVRYLATNMQSFTVPANSISRTHLDSNLQAGFQGRNRIINGDMRIDQRNAGAAVTATDAYPVDRMRIQHSTDGAYSAQQNSTAPAGFVKSIKVTTTSADASLGATQYLLLQQRIEGSNTADLAWGTSDAKTVTLSFWVRSSLTGTFGGVLGNSSFNRSYPYTYTINAADTWEYKTVTITGDTTGTWVTDSSDYGIVVRFGLGIGSSYSGTAGSWQASGLMSATGATSLIGTNGATFYITGIQLEEGTTATSFERESYSVTLQKCQRYYQSIFGQNSQTMYLGRSYAASVGNGVPLNLTYKVTMRAAPTVTRVGTWQIFNVTAQPVFGGTTIDAVYMYASASGAGDSGFYTDAASVGVTFSAEL